MTKHLYVETHGCQMNVADSNTITDSLKQAFDIIETPNAAEADILVMNTCSIREKPQERYFQNLAGGVQSKKNVLIY